jgi:hypothetical protein
MSKKYFGGKGRRGAAYSTGARIVFLPARPRAINGTTGIQEVNICK